MTKIDRGSRRHVFCSAVLCAFAAPTLAVGASQASDLIITGVVDGPLTGGIPKAIELFATADVADLSTYGLGSANNGGGSDGEELTLSGSATAGQFIYVASEAPAFTSFFGFAPDFTGAAASINGDDAIELFENGAVVDTFGELDVDGTGQAWEYLDGWAYRSSSTGPDGQAFELGSWTFSGANALDGESDNASAAAPFPISSYTTAPGVPLVITGVIDGPLSGGVPKAVEVFVLSDIADLSACGLGSANNGGGSDGEEFTFSGAATAGEYLYVATESTGFTSFFGFAPTFTDGSATNINGDDAIELFCDGVVVDVFGDINIDGSGQPWEHLDGWAYRLVDTGPDGDAFVLSNWTFSGTNALDGAANNDSASTPFPIASYDSDDPPPAVEECGDPATPIYDVQGTGASTPLNGLEVSVEGIVTGDFQSDDGVDGDLRGFYIQEVTPDGDPSTSDGIFVFESSTIVDVAVGTLVRVSGFAGEFFDETQITAQAVLDCAQSGSITPTPVPLPAASVVANADGELIADLEQYEGMLITLPDTLEVTELFNLDRFGEMRLAQGGRFFQFTNTNAPSHAGFALHQQQVASRNIMLDDGLALQNPDPIPYPPPGLDSSNPVRMGDTVTGLTGNLRFSRGSGGSGDESFRIVPTESPTFVVGNPRPPAPSLAGTLKLTSFNVLNFFNTIDDGTSCFLGGVQVAGACRGADTALEFDRQTEKLVTAIAALDADVYGLVELENDYPEGMNSSIVTLVDALNTAGGTPGCGANFDYIDPADHVGTDAIAVGFIYCAATVQIEPGTSIATLTDSDLPGLGLNPSEPVFDGVATNRVPMAVSFAEISTGEALTVAINHFKSKGASTLDDSGSTCGVDIDPLTEPNCDQGDGQGFWNFRRTLAAQAVDAWLQSAPTGSTDPDYLILGDLNAYLQESPIQTLEAAGYVNLLNTLGDGSDSYSFVFDGQAGALDHALANPSLASQVVDLAEWHANADEPDGLDYNLDFGRPATIFNGSDPYRNSDHDPLVLGLSLNTTPAGCDCDAPGAIVGTNSADFLIGTPGPDIICGERGADLIFGLGGNDCIVGGRGLDTIFAGNGNDFVDGGRGADLIIGNAGNDVLIGSQGNDVARGGSGDDQCEAEHLTSCEL